MKKIYFLIVGLLIISIVAFVYKNTESRQKNVGTEWGQYMNGKLGFSFEYPSNEVSLVSQKSDETIITRFDNSNGNILTVPIDSAKVIVVSVIPTTSEEVNSVDDWIKIVSERSKNSPGGNPFLNIKYDLVDNTRVAIYSDSLENSTALNTHVLFFLSKQLYSIFIGNFSLSETEHIWKSFKFKNI